MSVVEYREYSVLMSVYHKEKPEYLKQAIESIQAQTFPTDAGMRWTVERTIG